MYTARCENPGCDAQIHNATEDKRFCSERCRRLAWQKANPDKAKGSYRKYRQNTRRRIFQRDGYKCAYCHQKFEEDQLELDHVIPYDLGGYTEASNIVTSCAPCNNAKSMDMLTRRQEYRLLKKIEYRNKVSGINPRQVIRIRGYRRKSPSAKPQRDSQHGQQSTRGVQAKGQLEELAVVGRAVEDEEQDQD